MCVPILHILDMRNTLQVKVQAKYFMRGLNLIELEPSHYVLVLQVNTEDSQHNLLSCLSICMLCIPDVSAGGTHISDDFIFFQRLSCLRCVCVMGGCNLESVDGTTVLANLSQ